MYLQDRNKKNKYGRFTVRNYGKYKLFHFGGDYYGYLDADNLLHYLPNTYKTENVAFAALSDFIRTHDAKRVCLLWQGNNPKEVIDEAKRLGV